MKRKIFFFAHSRLIFLFPISTGQRYGKVESSVCYYMEQAKHNPCWWLVVSGFAVVCNCSFSKAGFNGENKSVFSLVGWLVGFGLLIFFF